MRHKDGETSDNDVSHFFFYSCKPFTANEKDSSTSLGMTIGLVFAPCLGFHANACAFALNDGKNGGCTLDFKIECEVSVLPHNSEQSC